MGAAAAGPALPGGEALRRGPPAAGTTGERLLLLGRTPRSIASMKLPKFLYLAIYVLGFCGTAWSAPAGTPGNAWETARRATFGLLGAAAALPALARRDSRRLRWRRPAGTPRGAAGRVALAAPRPTVPELLAARYGDRLSSRDLELCRLAILGVSERDIGLQLGLPEARVQPRLHRVCHRLGVPCPAELYRRLVDPERAG